MPWTACSFFGCHKIFWLKFFASKGFSHLVGIWLILVKCKYVGCRLLFLKHTKLIGSGKRPSVSGYRILFVSRVENNGCKTLAAIFYGIKQLAIVFCGKKFGMREDKATILPGLIATSGDYLLYKN